MSKRQLTERQQEIKGLMDGQPGITATEIADVLETSVGSVYQSQSRMRAMGYLPKTSKKRSRKRSASRAPALATAIPSPPAAVATNGSVSHDVETLLASEIDLANQRYAEIETTETELATEKGEIGERRRRLVAAQEALTNAVK